MLTSHDNETIIAQASPNGAGAIALLRITGLHALELCAQASKLASGKSLLDVPTHTIHYGWIVDAHGNTIDQVMITVMHSPRTFTGQDTVEVTCHNNPFIIQAIIARALECGMRLAQNGEFTKRAVLNKKIDLLKAEAINELIHANTHMALKKSLAQVHGSFSHWVTTIEQDLTKALALSEASFEFIDEQMEFGTQITSIIEQIQKTIITLKKNFDLQQQIRQGVRIALVGSVNAGKSSLFNALLGTQRAIVTSIAGTTRDSIEAGMYKKNSYWTLIDTAGLRNTDNLIEQEGITRSLREASLADIVIVVVDQARNITPQERAVYEDIIAAHQHKIIVVHNKADLPAVQLQPLPLPAAIAVSSAHGNNIQALEDLIEKKIDELCTHADSPFLLNNRQFTLMLTLEQKLAEIKTMTQPPVQYELLSYHLIDALTHISELTGKTISEQGMDAVFREFCVGK